MKALIIEDHEPSRDALARLVKASWKIDTEDLEVVTAATLSEGLSLADGANLTILDLALPDSDLPNTIQNISRFAPPVIVLTGDISDEVTTSCIAAGAKYVFHKGTAVALMLPAIFESMQSDIFRRAAANHGTR